MCAQVCEGSSVCRDIHGSAYGGQRLTLDNVTNLFIYRCLVSSPNIAITDLAQLANQLAPRNSPVLTSGVLGLLASETPA